MFSIWLKKCSIAGFTFFCPEWISHTDTAPCLMLEVSLKDGYCFILINFWGWLSLWLDDLLLSIKGAATLQTNDEVEGLQRVDIMLEKKIQKTLTKFLKK